MRKQILEADVLELARERIAKTFDRFDTVVVSFSGGKDSTVCLQLALEAAVAKGKLPLRVAFYDEEAQAPETIEYMHRVAAMPEVDMRWYCLPVQHRNACSRRSPFWHPWAPEDEAKWCRPLPKGAITHVPGFNRCAIPAIKPLLYGPELGQVGIIIGLRAAESLRRFRIVTQRVYDNYVSVYPDAHHIYLVKPIYDWTTEDVWTAPAKLGWDYNRAYDVMERAGITRHVQRVCPPYGEEPLQNLWMYSVCWPELWDKMSVRVPGAATAARYSRSPVYAFGGVVGPGEGGTWPGLISAVLGKWAPDRAAIIAERLKQFMQLHAKDSGGAPITEDPHPVTGVGWRMLYTIAVRGDFKARKNRKLMTLDDDGASPNDD